VSFHQFFLATLSVAKTIEQWCPQRGSLEFETRTVAIRYTNHAAAAPEINVAEYEYRESRKKSRKERDTSSDNLVCTYIELMYFDGKNLKQSHYRP
jgi:hypothetical protein